MSMNENKTFCQNCKKEIPSDSMFCQFCGSKVETQDFSSADDTNETIVNSQVDNDNTQKSDTFEDSFGLVPDNPVYTRGIAEQEKYLKSLRTTTGEPIKWIRSGSISLSEVNGVVDIYDIYLMSGEKYKTIYINMYGNCTSTEAPKGFSRINEERVSVITPTTKKQNNSKQKKMKFLVIVMAIILLLIFVAIPEIKYQQAKNLLAYSQKDGLKRSDVVIEKSELAYEKFSSLGNYRQSKELLKECIYQKARGLSSKYLISSTVEIINLYESLGDYKDAKEELNEEKYQYVTGWGANADDLNVFEYLKELKSIDYKDSANLYKKYYDWKIEVVAINSSESDTETNKTSIKKNTPVYFHIKLSGGEPNESVRISVKNYINNKESSGLIFNEKWTDGTAGYYAYPNGLSTSGTVKCYFYDEDENIIGGGSITITEY